MIHLFLLKYFILTYGVEISISMNDFNDYLDYKENDVFFVTNGIDMSLLFWNKFSV